MGERRGLRLFPLTGIVVSSAAIILTDDSASHSRYFTDVTVAHQGGLTIRLLDLVWARGFGSIRGVRHLESPQ